MLPRDYFDISEKYIRSCDLLLVLGSSLEIKPVSTLPAIARKNSAKVIYVNLQIIKNVRHVLIRKVIYRFFQKYFNFGIHAKVDDVFKKVMENLNLPVVCEFHPHTHPVLCSEFPIHEDRVFSKESPNQRKRKLNDSPNFERKECHPKIGKTEETVENSSNNSASDDRDEMEIDKDLIVEEKVFISPKKETSDESLPSSASDGVASTPPDPIASTPPDSFVSTPSDPIISTSPDPIVSTSDDIIPTSSDPVVSTSEDIVPTSSDPIVSTPPDPIISTSSDPIAPASPVKPDSTDLEVNHDTIEEITVDKDIESIEETSEAKFCENCPNEADDTQNLTTDSKLDQSPSSNIIENDG